ncbi:MAG: hypothetical protein NTW86_02645 [Candidatus Sumerlaeota bacterium]|nr:hypothetical protein [Candidatus Sumerlaeota bacterium]
MNLASQMLIKLNRIENSYRALRYETVARLDAKYYDTKEHLRSEPRGVSWKPIARDTTWAGDWLTRWFVCDFTATAPCAGKRLFVKAKTGALETLLFVNGEAKGVFDGRAINTPTTNHTVMCIDLKAAKGRKYHLALEAYCGHTRRGGHIDNSEKGLRISKDSDHYEHIDIVIARDDVCAFYYGFLVLRRLMQGMDAASLRRNEIQNGLEDVIAIVDPLPEETGEASWRPKMRRAHAVLKALLARKNGPSMPRAGRLLSRNVVSNGPVQLRIRSVYGIGARSTVTQDMTLWADSPRIDFETRIEWKEIHTLFQAAFDLGVLSDMARYEIQYGHLERPRHTNLDEDKAMFECAVQKWLDISETGFGVALLNDCK